MLSPNEKLDEILKFLCSDITYSYTIEEIISCITFKPNESEAYLMLKKLEKDGYVNLVVVDIQKKSSSITGIVKTLTTYNYHITFDGTLFYSDEGYKRANDDARIEKRKEKMNECLLILGTWLAGIGALSLTAWELYKHYYLHLD